MGDIKTSISTNSKLNYVSSPKGGDIEKSTKEAIYKGANQLNIELEEIDLYSYGESTPEVFNDLKKEFQNGKGSYFEILNIVDEALIESFKKGNIDAEKIAKKLTELKQKNPNLHFVPGIEKKDNTFWDKNNSVVNIGKMELENKIKSTIVHETGHLLFDEVLQAKMPSDFENILNQAKTNFSTTLNSNYIEFDSLYQITDENIRKEISHEFLDDLEKGGFTLEEYQNSLIEKYNQSPVAVMELRAHLQEAGYSQEQINNILKNDITSEEMAKQEMASELKKRHEIKFQIKYGEIPAILDIIEAVFEGEQTDLSGNPINTDWGHGKEYFSEGNHIKHEIMADYFNLKINYPDSISTLEKLFGKEFVNMLDDTYSQMIN